MEGVKATVDVHKFCHGLDYQPCAIVFLIFNDATG